MRGLLPSAAKFCSSTIIRRLTAREGRERRLRRSPQGAGAAPRARSYASRLMAASKTAQKSCSSLPIARARL